MKKTLSLILSFIMIVVFASFPAQAKIFHQCHCCGGDGIYTCDATDCKNGRITCGGCGGTGQTTEKCAECGGTGKCRMCNGTGKRLGDSTIACDNCKGTGQCQGGPGWGPCKQGYYYNTCQDCKGEGTVWHNSEWCTYARNHGGKCPICKGTGYEGDGVEGTPNDGVSNVPRAGDGIYYLNGTYGIYGGASGKNSGGGSGGGSTQTPTAGNGTSAAQNNGDTGESDILLPEDRHETVYLGTSDIENNDFTGKPAVGVVRYQEMNESQKSYYDSLSDEELGRLLSGVRDIISTVRVGEISDESQSSVDEFCKVNGIKSVADSNILPVSFEGHIQIGFPVLVSVEVNPELFSGSKPMHVFHVKEEGLIFQIPDENVFWVTDEQNGKIIRTEFYTDSFSDFLLSDTGGLVMPADVEAKSDEGAALTTGTDNGLRKETIIAAVAAFVLVLIAVFAVFALKKRKADNAVDVVQESAQAEEAPKDEQ